MRVGDLSVRNVGSAIGINWGCSPKISYPASTSITHEQQLRNFETHFRNMDYASPAKESIWNKMVPPLILGQGIVQSHRDAYLEGTTSGCRGSAPKLEKEERPNSPVSFIPLKTYGSIE